MQQNFFTKKSLGVFNIVWILFITSSLLFVLFPQIDLYISSLFYYAKEGFSTNGTWYEKLLYDSVKPVVAIAAALPILIWFYNLASKKNLLHVNAKVVLYALLVLAIGPGIIVNDIFKEHWGRARPAQTVEFGGKLEFTPAFVISDQGGYSFSCGHAAGAFFLLSLALLAKRKKAFWITLASAYGIAISYIRIAAGGHYLSDTVVSFFIVFIVSLMLHHFIFKDKTYETS
ncbi:phosphatase PAP2 family protein [Sulfurimonas sp. HSL-1716]|uniref:phosphatase PAP2 family protein n=1 Tax=Hydrocurvibacter sulfurireducens TaxID=3131937 RepID=UPI0031F83AD5